MKRTILVPYTDLLELHRLNQKREAPAVYDAGVRARERHHSQLVSGLEKYLDVKCGGYSVLV